MENEQNCQINKKKDRHGANNPMFGRKHSDEARRKQSEAAKKRNMEFQKWKAANKPMTMDERARQFNNQRRNQKSDMEGIRQQYIDMVTRFEEARWISVQYWMLQDFKKWYDKHQDTLTDEEKEYLKENIRLRRKGTRTYYPR